MKKPSPALADTELHWTPATTSPIGKLLKAAAKDGDGDGFIFDGTPKQRWIFHTAPASSAAFIRQHGLRGAADGGEPEVWAFKDLEAAERYADDPQGEPRNIYAAKVDADKLIPAGEGVEDGDEIVIHPEPIKPDQVYDAYDDKVLREIERADAEPEAPLAGAAAFGDLTPEQTAVIRKYAVAIYKQLEKFEPGDSMNCDHASELWKQAFDREGVKARVAGGFYKGFEDVEHVYLVLGNGTIFDPTAAQFGSIPSLRKDKYLEHDDFPPDWEPLDGAWEYEELKR